MAFRPANLARLATFNSANSCEFLEFYDAFVDEKIRAENAEPKHQTFAPSSFRCSRKSWFRLRGVDPDQPKSIDKVLNFSAEMGTACHRIIQTNLKEALGEDWIDVGEYLRELNPSYKYTLSKSEDSLETQIEILDPPVRFACDGVIRWKGKLYLLEIKTSEYSSFTDLTDPKDEHIDQIRCYATLLNLPNVLVLYQDRQYGEFKCYEKQISLSDMDAVMREFQYVQDMVEANLPPKRLPTGDVWCSRCEYSKKCKEWG